MQAGPDALALIKGEEGCRLTAYQDSRGIWTIGWGHTGPEVVAGLVWTQAQADAQLAADVAARAVGPLNASLARPIPQGCFDALVSWTYNVGGGAEASSTVVRLLNAGDFKGAHQHLADWKRAGADPDRLLPRRMHEAWLFARSAP